MYPFVESIKIENRKHFNLAQHQARLERTLAANYQVYKNFNLEDLIIIPDYIDQKTYKCRFCYNDENFELSFIPYNLRPISRLKIIESPNIDYTYKTTDRSQLDKLFTLRSDADDIIITKQGYITDTWAANVLLQKENIWYTPKNPLLKGTQRQHLINKGVVFEENIHKKDLKTYDKVRIINAMITFEDELDISIEHIKL